jgi:hypothetical protein
MTPVEPGIFLERNPYLNVYAPVAFTHIEGGRARYMHASRIARRAE